MKFKDIIRAALIIVEHIYIFGLEFHASHSGMTYKGNESLNRVSMLLAILFSTNFLQ